MLKKQLIDLKQKKNAVILAHYYTLPEVQEVADFDRGGDFAVGGGDIENWDTSSSFV